MDDPEDAPSQEEVGRPDDIDNGDDDDDDDDDDPPRGFWLVFSSNMLFLLGSAFYMWLSVMDFQWAKEVETFAELIDGEFSLRDNAVQEIKNAYENAEDDDAIFSVRFHDVSKYQIVYYFAAGFLMVEGFVDFFGAPDWRGIFFIFAGTTGLLSAWLAERDANLSTIFGLISAHLYMMEAIGLVLYRDDYSKKWLAWTVCGVDVCFVIATMIDVALSYTAVFKVFEMELVKMDVAAATLWLFCAVFYVGATVYAKYCGYFEKSEFEPLSSSAEGDKQKNMSA